MRAVPRQSPLTHIGMPVILSAMLNDEPRKPMMSWIENRIVVPSGCRSLPRGRLCPQCRGQAWRSRSSLLFDELLAEREFMLNERNGVGQEKGIVAVFEQLLVVNSRALIVLELEGTFGVVIMV